MLEFYGLVFLRSLFILAGILLVYFGYRLLLVALQSQGEIGARLGKELRPSLGTLVPGALFAIFGAALLVYSLVSPVADPDYAGEISQARPAQSLQDRS